MSSTVPINSKRKRPGGDVRPQPCATWRAARQWEAGTEHPSPTGRKHLSGKSSPPEKRLFADQVGGPNIPALAF